MQLPDKTTKNSWAALTESPTPSVVPVCRGVVGDEGCCGGKHIVCTGGQLVLTDTCDGMNKGWYERFPWYCHACLEVKRGPSRWHCNACAADLCLECGEKGVRRTLGEKDIGHSPHPTDGGRAFSPNKMMQSIADPSIVSVDFTGTFLGYTVFIPRARLTSVRRVAVAMFDFLLVVTPVGIGLFNETLKSYLYAFDGCCPTSLRSSEKSGNDVGGCLTAPMSFEYCLKQNDGKSVVTVTGMERAFMSRDDVSLFNFLVYQCLVLLFALFAYNSIRLELKRSRRLLPFGIYTSRRLTESSTTYWLINLMIYVFYVVLFSLFLITKGEENMRIPLANNATLYATFKASNPTKIRINALELYKYVFTLGVLYIPMFVRLFLYRARRFGDLKPRVLAVADEIHADEHLLKFDGLQTLRRIDELTLSLVPSLAEAEKDTTSDADISQGLQLLNRPVSLLQAFATASDELARYRLVGLPLIEIDVVFQYSRRVLGVLFSLSLVSFVLETPSDYRAGTPNVDVTAIFNRSSDTMWPLAWPVAVMALAMIWTIVSIVRAKVWARKSYLHELENVPQPKLLRENRFLFCHNCACLQLIVALLLLLFLSMPLFAGVIFESGGRQMLHLAKDRRSSDGWCLALEQTALPWHLRLEDCAKTPSPSQYFTHNLKGRFSPKSAPSLCLHGNATARTVFFDVCRNPESPTVSWDVNASSTTIQLKGTGLCLGILNYTKRASVIPKAVLSESACTKDLFLFEPKLFQYKLVALACLWGVVVCLFVSHALEKGSKMAAKYSIPPWAVQSYIGYFRYFRGRRENKKNVGLWEYPSE